MGQAKSCQFTRSVDNADKLEAPEPKRSSILSGPNAVSLILDEGRILQLQRVMLHLQGYKISNISRKRLQYYFADPIP